MRRSLRAAVSRKYVSGALTAVTSTRASTWAVIGTLTSVSATRATTWVARAVQTVARSTTWVARAAQTATRSTLWSVLASSGSGALTDRLDQTWVSNSISSTYHIFAAGLDWGQPVGLLMYTDGSGAFGLKNPNNTYLLDADGSAGLVAVAKARNLLLVTPTAPLPGDADGDNCWYNTTGSPNAWEKAGWADALMTYVRSQYTIDPDRVVIGGYSSGAQWTTRYFLPGYGESQGVKLAVAIAFGGSPDPTTWSPSSTYKANTVVSFDTGQDDTTGAYDTAAYGARGGYNWYTNAGFVTDFLWPAGVTHARDGEFDTIMAREIDQWLDYTPPPPGSGASFRSSSTLSFGGVAAPVINAPAGVVSGDMLVAIGGVDANGTSSFNAPAGWTAQVTQSYGSGTPKAKVWTKTATGSEPSTYTWASTTSFDGRLDIIAIQGAGTTPVVASGTTAASTSSHTAPTVTASTSSGVLVCAAVVAAASGLTSSWTAPSGMTERTDANQGGYVSQTTATQDISASGATGTRTFGATLSASLAAGVFSVFVPSA